MADSSHYLDRLKNKVVTAAEEDYPRRMHELTALYEMTTPGAPAMDLIRTVQQHAQALQAHLRDIQILASNHLVMQMEQVNGEVVVAADKLEALLDYVGVVSLSCLLNSVQPL